MSVRWAITTAGLFPFQVKGGQGDLLILQRFRQERHETGDATQRSGKAGGVIKRTGEFQARPWSSLVVGDVSAQSKSCCICVKTRKTMQHIHGIIP